jgi:L-amino acid N-acyltransferase YncA
MSIAVRAPTPEDTDALLAFFLRVPDGERSFFKEQSVDRETVAAWLAPDARGRRAIAVDDAGEVVGQVAVVPLQGWSDHVAETRLIVDPARRRAGIGKLLARRAVLDGIECGMRKLMVEVVAEQDGTVSMFEALGFRAEGMLEEQVRDRDGNLQDLIVLSHSLRDQSALMSAVGIDQALHG